MYEESKALYNRIRKDEIDLAIGIFSFISNNLKFKILLFAS